VRKILIVFSAGVLIVLGAASLAAANNGQWGRHDTVPVFDHYFVKDALRSGAFEIMSNDDASTRAAAPYRPVAAMIAGDHRAAGAELQSIAMNLGWEAPTTPSPTQMWIVQQLKATPTGPAYDAAYLSSQIAAHEQAIELFMKEATWGQQWEVQSYAQRSLPVLQHHLDELMALRDGSGSPTTPSTPTTAPTTTAVPVTTSMPASTSTTSTTLVQGS
jgi:putative membrane protein